MDEADQIITYIFILSLVLVAVAYFAGFRSDVSVLSGAFNSLIQVSTGRNAQGQFAGYPTGQ